MLLKDKIDVFVESRTTPRRRFLKSQAEEDRDNNRKTNPDSSPEHEKLIVEENRSVPSAIADRCFTTGSPIHYRGRYRLAL